jgi:membrane protein
MHEESTSPWKLGGLSLKDLGKRVWKEVQKDAIFDVSAILGFYFLLALFPMLIFLVSLLSYMSTPVLMNKVLSLAAGSMPPDAYKILADQMSNILQQSKGGLLTFGAIATLWSASSGVTSIMDGLNRAYDVEDQRTIIKKRALSLGITLGLTVLTVLGAAILVGSDQIAQLLQDATGVKAIATIGSIVGALLGLAFMFVGLEVVYYYGPNVKNQKWAWITPGSLLGVVIFLAVSFGFSLYLRFSNTYNATYGSIGGVIILMLWLYYLGVAILAGGEVNAIIAAAALKNGNKEAPKFGVEEDTDRENIKSTSKPKDADTTPRRASFSSRYEPSHPFYSFDEERMSRQTQKRIAQRRLARRERSVQHGTSRTTGWAILKRPVTAAVYLGSIGYFMATAIMKHVQQRPSTAESYGERDARELQGTRPAPAARSPRAAQAESRRIPAETSASA